MGLTLRALGCGLKVYYLRLVKPRWKTGELAICADLHPNLTFRNVEQDWILSKSRHIPEHVSAMRTALATAMDDLERIVVSADDDLVIVDEITYCISHDLLPLELAAKLVDSRPRTAELAFIGR